MVASITGPGERSGVVELRRTCWRPTGGADWGVGVGGRRGAVVRLPAAGPAHHGDAADAVVADAAAGLLAAQHVRPQQAVVVPHEDAPALHAGTAAGALLPLDLLPTRQLPLPIRFTRFYWVAKGFTGF